MKKLLLVSAIVSCVLNTNAFADETPKTFLEGLKGEFRGRGEAVVELSNQKVRLSCKLANNVSSNSTVLDISGVCATTQGKANVNGKLQVVGNKVEGSFISPFKDSEITQSSSQYNNGKLVLSTSFVNKTTGNLSRMRQIVESAPQGGFNSTFQKYDNASGAYKNTGFVKFSPVAN